MIYLLDTDTFILLLRGTAIAKPHSEREKQVQKSASKILSHCKRKVSAGHQVGLSAISIAELEFGLHRSQRYERQRALLTKALTPFATYPFDAVDCVHHYGIIRSTLELQGQPIGPLDTLIAAHAAALGATLVTHNTREFRRVKALTIADWSSPTKG